MTATWSCPACGRSATCENAAAAEHQSPHCCAHPPNRPDPVARGDQQGDEAAIRECAHSGGPHRHGTRTAYVKDRCRCPGCRGANSAASRAAYRDRTLGRPPLLIDAAPARAHIGALRAAGIGVNQIARLTGLAPSHIRDVGHHESSGAAPTRRIRPDTATRLLAITATDTNRAPGSHVTATGTRRRLHALVATGWTPARLATELGRDTANLRRSMTSTQVTARTATQVADLYERLWNTAPPHATDTERAAIQTARGLAARHGWSPPMAWDDIDTDPHPRQPAKERHAAQLGEDLDEIAIERAVTGDGIRLKNLTPAEQHEAVRRLTARGKSCATSPTSSPPPRAPSPGAEDQGAQHDHTGTVVLANCPWEPQMTGDAEPDLPLPAGYADLLGELKAGVAAARWRAQRFLNTETLALHWRLGHAILSRQHAQGWGTRIIDRLAADLRAAFPGMRGLSLNNLFYLRSFAGAWPQDAIVQHAAGRLPPGHLTVLLDKAPYPAQRDWYAAAAVDQGWSRNGLTHQIMNQLHQRTGGAPSNFLSSCPRRTPSWPNN